MTAVVERLPELVRCEVDGVPCTAYPRLTGPVEEDDEVIVNVQARELGLGSGGFDVLYANLTRGLDLPAEAGAHVMKLPYTPLQHAVLHAEETDQLVRGLAGMPVVCCSLHSQVAPVCAGIGEGVRTAYVQVPGGALPVSLSGAVRALKARGLLETAVAVGACIDGDVHCVTTASALVWAKAAGFDAAVCAIGPGIVGTGTFLGHGGVAAADAANATIALGGTPVLAVRMSDADERERHRDVSHHAMAVIEQSLGDLTVGAEATFEELAADSAGLPLSHMGRGPDDDPAFFVMAYAAGRVVRDLVG
ncbi:MAG TPA: DUF3866 family protein [Gaiellaceae bacterium]|nr:DUF3866 family protein [Gaiellaceae bacterium]